MINFAIGFVAGFVAFPFVSYGTALGWEYLKKGAYAVWDRVRGK